MIFSTRFNKNWNTLILIRILRHVDITILLQKYLNAKFEETLCRWFPSELNLSINLKGKLLLSEYLFLFIGLDLLTYPWIQLTLLLLYEWSLHVELLFLDESVLEGICPKRLKLMILGMDHQKA